MIENRERVLADEPALGDKRAYDPRAWGSQRTETARLAELAPQPSP